MAGNSLKIVAHLRPGVRASAPEVAAVRLFSLLPRQWMGTVDAHGDEFVVEISFVDDIAAAHEQISKAFAGDELAGWEWSNRTPPASA